MKFRNATRHFFTPLPWLVGVLVLNAVVVDLYLIHQFFAGGSVLGTTSEACPSACIAKMNQVAGKTVSGSAKEYYVPLGSGTNASDDWVDVAGASAYVDTASYGRMKQATFEATVTVPAGSQRVWVRLYNATDKHPVWFSEVTPTPPGQSCLRQRPLRSIKEISSIRCK